MKRNADASCDGRPPVIVIQRRIKEIDEIERMAQSGESCFEWLFDLVCCYTMKDVSAEFELEHTPPRALYLASAERFREMLDILLVNDDFNQRVLCHFTGNRVGERAEWPKGFAEYVITLCDKIPTDSFKKQYVLPGDSHSLSLFINLGHLVYSTFVATEAFAKTQFLPLWRNPRPSRDETVTGVLNAIRARLFGAHFRDKAISIVDTEWTHARSEKEKKAFLSEVGCANKAALEMKIFNECSKNICLDKWYPKHWASVYVLGEPSRYQNHMTIPSLCKIIAATNSGNDCESTALLLKGSWTESPVLSPLSMDSNLLLSEFASDHGAQPSRNFRKSPLVGAGEIIKKRRRLMKV